MDYTREPIIETVLSPREGYKLVLKSTKFVEREEIFVDAVEIVTFGTAHFYRSLERPKPFLLPVSDFEVVEVREPRMVLKHVSVDKQVKIGGTRDKENKPESSGSDAGDKGDAKNKKKRVSKRKKKDESSRASSENTSVAQITPPPLIRHEASGTKQTQSTQEMPVESNQETSRRGDQTPPVATSSLLAPPTTLISDTLSKYRNDETFKNAFYQGSDSDSEEDETYSEEVFSEESILESDEDFDVSDRIVFTSSAQVPSENALEKKPQEELVEQIPTEDNVTSPSKDRSDETIEKGLEEGAPKKGFSQEGFLKQRVSKETLSQEGLPKENLEAQGVKKSAEVAPGAIEVDTNVSLDEDFEDEESLSYTEQELPSLLHKSEKSSEDEM